MLTIVGFSVGFAIVVGGLFGSFLSILSMVTFLSTAIGLVLTFTLLGIVIGSIVRTRWQALAVSVGLWFVLVIAWPTLWFAVLSAVPYSLIQPLLLGGFAFNPAEWMRIVAILAFGSGSILGPDYHKLVINAANPLTWLGASVYMLLWIGIHFITACMIWEKRRYNG
jgi:Cu-processing system permease protein